MKAFAPRFRPAPVHGGYAEADFFVWCGSVIRGQDTRYHMFASRFPRSLPFTCWATHSEIVRAVSDTPEGPYRYAETVLGRTGADRWDGCSLHNPCVQQIPEGYAMFYSGAAFSGPYPASAEPERGHTPQWLDSWNRQRIGVATAPALEGPWTRVDAPLLEPRPGEWDAVITTNPAVVVHKDGSVLMIYKSIALPYTGETLPAPFQFGVATAPSVLGPYTRRLDAPLFADADLEDPHLWWQDGRYQMLAKDMNGALSGEARAGIHATSTDGLAWTLSEPPRAYGLEVNWEDGRTTQQPFLERVHVLLHDGRPTHLFFATADEGAGYASLQSTRNIVLPLDVN